MKDCLKGASDKVVKKGIDEKISEAISELGLVWTKEEVVAVERNDACQQY